MRFIAFGVPSAAALVVSRREGLELLDWLGLGRPEFGAIDANDLAPRCRRRLWPIPRNGREDLRARTQVLLALAEAAAASSPTSGGRKEAVVMFG
jgi:hypothetical protein